mgnify:CR=1 FL=1|tara:strand:- start:286 stop:870 length:585 start_codon:yes stop_codon:yes gene_type:complete
MTDFEAYRQFLALKLHFTSENYDYFRYNGKHNATMASFDKRTDKRFFKKLVRKNINITEYYVANLVNGKEWISQFEDSVWKEWLARSQSIEYNFINEAEKLLTLAGNFDIIFNCDEGTHPKLLKAYLAKKISLETLVILDRLVRYRKVFDREIDESYIWPKVSMLIQKYEPFVKVNIVKCRRMLIEKTRELNDE